MLKQCIKGLILVLVLVILGFGVYSILGVSDSPDNNIELKSKKFYLLIENYNTPSVNVSVSTMKRNSDLIGQIVSVRCEIENFKGYNEKTGVIQDTVKQDSMNFIFLDSKIPNGKVWAEYLTEISGTDTEVIMHGRLLKTDKEVFFVPQRLFMTNNLDLTKELQRLKVEKGKKG